MVKQELHREVGFASWGLVEYHATITIRLETSFAIPFGGPVQHAVKIPVILKEMLYIPRQKQAEHNKDQRALNISANSAIIHAWISLP